MSPLIEVGKTYENAKGRYTVLAIQDGRLLVRYDGGAEQELDLKLQQRIQQNAHLRARKVQKNRQQSKSRANRSQNYQNRCWRCGNTISSKKNERCAQCGWLRCKCGACNCNRARVMDALDPYL